MNEYYDTQAWIEFLKQNKFKVFLAIAIGIIFFGSVVRLYHMECSRQSGRCVISQFYLEKLSYQEIDNIPISQIQGMAVFSTTKSWGRKRKIPSHQLKLITNTADIELEMFSTPYVVGNKTKKAENFNRFLSNTSQMTYTYREGMGFIWVFLGILALAWVVFKKFYDECNVINRRIFNRKHNIKEPDNDGF